MIVPAAALADGDPASDVLLARKRLLPLQPTRRRRPAEDPERRDRAGEPGPLPDQGGADRHPGRSRSDPDPVRQTAAVRRLPGPGDQLPGEQATPAGRNAKRIRRSGSGQFSNRRRRDAKTTDGLGEQRPRAGGHRRGAEARRGRRPSDQRRCRAPSTSGEGHGATELSVGALVFVAVLASAALLCVPPPAARGPVTIG